MVELSTVMLPEVACLLIKATRSRLCMITRYSKLYSTKRPQDQPVSVSDTPAPPPPPHILTSEEMVAIRRLMTTSQEASCRTMERPSSRPSPTATNDVYVKAVSRALGRTQILPYATRRVIRSKSRIITWLAFSTRFSSASSWGECFAYWTTTSQGSRPTSCHDIISLITSRPSASSKKKLTSRYAQPWTTRRHSTP